MFAVEHYLAGIAIIHLAWAYFYVTGTIFGRPQPDAARSSDETALEIITATAAGIALFGLVSMAIGLIGALYPITFAIYSAALCGALVIRGDSPFRGAFWTARWSSLRRAISPGIALVYAATLVLAIPAMLPETQFDSLFYHHVYALDWAQAHRIYVDMWRRFPYYANNWLLIDAWTFELGIGHFIDFFTWLTGALSVLGIYAYVSAIVAMRVPLRPAYLAPVAGVLSAAALLFSPIFLRWTNTGMVDVPLGFFFFACFIAVTMAFVRRSAFWIAALVTIAGFFIGMKISLIIFIPVFAILVVALALRSGATPKRAFALAACMIALSAPWYIKNFVQSGDPISPVLNLKFHHSDPKWSQADLDGVLADVQAAETPRGRLAVPFGIVFHTNTPPFREFGATVVLVLVGLPSFIMLYGLARAEVRESYLFIAATLVASSIAYWLVTTYLARYTLIFYPALICFSAACLIELLRRFPALTPAAIACMAVLALPSPGSGAWMKTTWDSQYSGIGALYTGRSAYLMKYTDAYPEEEYVSARLACARVPDPAVYMVRLEDMDFYYKEHGITAIGDWFGSERYSGFAAAIDRGQAAAYLKQFNASAVVMPHDADAFTSSEWQRLPHELAVAGFTSMTLPDRAATIFLDRKVADAPCSGAQ